MARRSKSEAPRSRRYLVDKRFQIKYTLMLVGFSAVVYGILGYLLYSKEMANTEILQIQDLAVAESVAAQDFTILYYLAAFFILQVASLFALGIFFTHRIAGPVYRVQKYLEELAGGGQVKPMVTIRGHDEFRDFFLSLGRVISTFSLRDDTQRGRLETLAQEIENAKDSPARLERCAEIVREILAEKPPKSIER